MEFVEELLQGEDEEEQWGTPAQHMIAGALAGTVEHCGMFPFDTVKTHMQAWHRPGEVRLSPWETGRHIVQRHGVRGLFRGLTAVAAGAAPAHAVYFGSYEFGKKIFGGRNEGHQPVATALAGICATVLNDGIFTPADALKQKMQLSAGAGRGGIVACFLHTLRTEGIARGFYGGFTTTLTMNVPYVAVYFSSYESFKKLAVDSFHYDGNATHVHLMAGAGAGICSGAFTNPLDVAKTRLQTQGETGRTYSGMRDAITTLFKEEGTSVFFRGILPRMAFHSTSAALCWATYEQIKYWLRK